MKAPAFIVAALVFAVLSRLASEAPAMELKSPAFQPGEYIPKKYSCRGLEMSPPLSWSGLPEGSESLAVICEDLDAPAGPVTHWVIFNIPSPVASLREGIVRQRDSEQGSRQGLNDFGTIGYRGPCPPEGSPHHYRFRLYALDTYFLIPGGSRKADLVEVMQGHILGQADLTGLFRREPRRRGSASSDD